MITVTPRHDMAQLCFAVSDSDLDVDYYLVRGRFPDARPVWVDAGGRFHISAPERFGRYANGGQFREWCHNFAHNRVVATAGATR